MKMDDFRKLLEKTKLDDSEGGCALAFATDSKGETTVVIKGNDREILTMLLAAMSQSTSIRDIVFSATKSFKLIRDSYLNQGS